MSAGFTLNNLLILFTEIARSGKQRRTVVWLAGITAYGLFAEAQQLPDYEYQPVLEKPAYTAGQGPLILVDQGHANFHTTSGRYHAFSTLLRADGYLVKGETAKLSARTLKAARILVIANAISGEKEKDWTNPIPPAFTQQEEELLVDWVAGGGRLLLIADHMPFPAATERLAARFGYRFHNGFAGYRQDSLFPGQKRELDLFSLKEGTLARHRITEGRNPSETVETVATFTGQAFEIPAEASSLITLPDGYIVLLPDTAWKFGTHVPVLQAKGFSQGAVRSFGQGRVAVFGEAAMFSSQLKGPDKIRFGFTAPEARDNQQFLLNIIHWLDDIL